MDHARTTPRRPLIRGWYLASSLTLAVLAVGCQPKDPTPPKADREAREQARAEEKKAAASQEHSVLTAAISDARDMDLLRRGFVRTLPSPSSADESFWSAAATAADGSSVAGRIAGRVVLGATIDPERGLSIREWLNTVMAQVDPRGQFSTADVVKVLGVAHPALGERIAALPPAVAEAVSGASPSEIARWTAAVEATPLPQLGSDDIPYLIRLGFDGRRVSTRLAWLLLALSDDPAVTETLLYTPPTHIVDPDQRAELIEWALRVHTTKPENRSRLVAMLADRSKGRAHERAVAVLTMWKDEAAIDALVLLVRTVALDPKNNQPPDISLRAFVEAMVDWPNERVQGSLAGYGQSGAPHRGLAKRAARAANAEPPKATLIERVGLDPHDARARMALVPLLTAEDAPALAELLGDTRWTHKGFFQWVRMLERVDPAALGAPVISQLEAVIERHPNAQIKEWALGVLGRAPGPLHALVTQAADDGSVAATRATIQRADDKWAALWARIASERDAVRRASYEVLIAPARLDFRPDAEQAGKLVEQTARHLMARPEEPWLFLRAMQQLTGRLAPADRSKLSQRVVDSLRPYCVTKGPNQKPRWEALFAARDLQTPEGRALLDEAVASVPIEGARAVMKTRLGLE